MGAPVDARTERVHDPRRRRTVALVLLGVGLGGFVDGIVLHQVLQWHHLLTDHGRTAYPTTGVDALETNTRADGVFHAATWAVVVVGVLLLIGAGAPRSDASWREVIGLLLVGWGSFNLVEGVVDHHVLTLHHVRDDVAEPLWWDLGFLGASLLLVAAGVVLLGRGRQVGPTRSR